MKEPDWVLDLYIVEAGEGPVKRSPGPEIRLITGNLKEYIGMRAGPHGQFE